MYEMYAAILQKLVEIVLLLKLRDVCDIREESRAESYSSRCLLNFCRFFFCIQCFFEVYLRNINHIRLKMISFLFTTCRYKRAYKELMEYERIESFATNLYVITTRHFK